MPKPKILMTSVGSFVGTNFLTCVQGRRDQVSVVGTNSLAEAPNNFACDTVYLSPETADLDHWLDTVHAIIGTEQPDLVLPGRDEDVHALALLRERDDDLRDRIAVGPPALAEMMLDKWATYEFARQNGVEFATSILTDHESISSDAEKLLGATGFPLVAKPRLGFGSHGVFFIINEAQLAKALDRPGFVIQEYLGDRADVLGRAGDLEAGVPLFFQIPDDKQFIGHTQIFPSGEISETYTQRTTMVMGRPVRAEPFVEPSLTSLIETCAARLAEAGWQGSINLQCRPRNGLSEFAAFEVGGRMSGATAARLVLGYDEVAILAEGFCGPGRLRRAGAETIPGAVTRTLTETAVRDADVAALQSEGIWRRGS